MNFLLSLFLVVKSNAFSLASQNGKRDTESFSLVRRIAGPLQSPIFDVENRGKNVKMETFFPIVYFNPLYRIVRKYLAHEDVSSQDKDFRQELASFFSQKIRIRP